MSKCENARSRRSDCSSVQVGIIRYRSAAMGLVRNLYSSCGYPLFPFPICRTRWRIARPTKPASACMMLSPMAKLTMEAAKLVATKPKNPNCFQLNKAMAHTGGLCPRPPILETPSPAHPDTVPASNHSPRDISGHQRIGDDDQNQVRSQTPMPLLLLFTHMLLLQ
jgi:hypothetical protein